MVRQTTNGHLQAGILSSTLEHAVPEQMFNTDPNNPVEGVSAVKALQLAAQQGQRIYEITPQNQATTLPNLRLQSGALSEISAGLNAGKHVIAHTDPISVPGWIGEGYIIYDPVDGTGAYKISGGGNGSFIFGFSLGILWTLSVLIFSAALLSGPISVLILSAISLISYSYVMFSFQGVSTVSCINAGFAIGLAAFIDALSFTGIGLGISMLLDLAGVYDIRSCLTRN